MESLSSFARILLLLALICALSQIAFPAPDGPARPRAGVGNGNGKRRLSESQLRQIIDGLRHKTGFQEMKFDESGLLVLGDRTRFAGGSATARELLIAAVDGSNAFELEAYHRAPEIAFADLTAGAIYTSFQTKTKIELRQVRLDFADFEELRGESEARTAFDLSFAILHELAHGVLRLTDAVGEAFRLGECDQLINRMRRELGLPERQGYDARIHLDVSGAAGVRLAELIFTRQRVKSSRVETEHFYLRWNAKKVAGPVDSKQATLIQYRFTVW